jgi:splicing factor 3B subunit 2
MAKTETKNQRRRAQKKAKKQQVRTSTILQCYVPVYLHNIKAHQKDATPNQTDTERESEEPTQEQPEPQLKSETKPSIPAPSPAPSLLDDDISEDDPLFEQFKDIIGKFQEQAEVDEVGDLVNQPEVYFGDDDEIPSEDDESRTKLSRKQKKIQNRLSIAELKALVEKPEIVEWTDTSASDPRLLLAIKSHRNVVPVPSHWSLKREYLSSKRGVEKAAFALPKFILDTGIAEMRDAVLEKQAEQSLKQQQRARVQPKMGKLDVDYQKLYEAFFKFQTKPELTRYGEVYYEGKEYETNLRHLRPGELSEDLKAALNIPPGAPPPWLINQQRFGPPPSYPAIKIPGLNAPLPPGADWGYHPGGYGKPPVDEYNRPLYGGDLIGILQPQQQQSMGEPVEKTLWGELQPPEEESEEEEDSDEENEEEDDEDAGAGLQTPGGLETPGGFASAVPSEYPGTESVGGEFTLRKQKRGTETEEAPRRSAYTVLPEQATSSQGFFGSSKVYDLKAAAGPTLDQDDGSSRRKRKAGDVDVSVDVDALEREDGLTKDEIAKRYEAQRQQEKSSNPWARVDQDDLSQMIADESRKRLKKDQERKAAK